VRDAAPLPRLHVVTDERIARRADLPDVAVAIAGSGDARMAFHARGRSLSGLDHYRLAIALSAYPPIRLFVNDRLDVALAAGAHGVQLTAGSLPPSAARRLRAEWRIGYSAHALAEARAALVEGADYLVVGPVYDTATHPAIAPLGLAGLDAFTRLGSPVIAIGGVTPERVPALLAAGAYGVAAIRAVWDAPDPALAVRAMLEALQ
jgi:thiamine-phosphate pyrophosphorylase